MEFKIVLGALAAGLALISYVPYIRDVLRRRTKPHAVSWLVWAVLSGVACVIQIQAGGMAGAWTLAVTAVVCGIITAMSVVWGETHLDRADIASVVAASCSLAVWLTTDNVLLAAMCVLLTDAIGGFLPTYRKSFLDPTGETAATYGINSVAFVLSIAALGELSMVTVLYPASLVVLNAGLAWMIVWRRSKRWQHPLVLAWESRRI